MKKIIHLFFICLSLWMASCTPSGYEKTKLGMKATVDSTEIEIQFFTPKIVRVVKSKSGFDFAKKSLAVIKEPETIKLKTETKGDGIVVSSSDVIVHLNLKTGKVSFDTPDGTSLLNEKDNGVQFTPVKDVDEDSYVVSQSFVLDQDEKVYGLGQFQDGKMSQRNQELYLLQDILITAIPMLQSNKGYGLYWDNYSPTYFSDTKVETSFKSTVGDCVDYYFMYGENADGVIAQMRDLTGQAPMFPYWTYGFWQSKERYKSQDEVVDVVKKYRELGVPLDGIIQDWQYWGDNYHWNAMEFLNPEFPEPQKLIDQVHDLNANIIFSIWSSFGPQTKQYKELEENNMLYDFKTWPLTDKNIWPQPTDAKPSGVRVYDAYNPKALDIYWKYLNSGIFSLGNDGWWMDSTEPDHFERKDEDYNQKTYLGSFRKYRNAYPLMTVGGVYTHQRETSSDKRVFILTRSAFAGQQRYGANSWSGDIVTDWDVLRNQISAGLNFSLCGIPYWNSDIGGFFTRNFPDGVKNKAYQEIYVRWLQFGTFCPMMRSHGTDTPREIYQFGQKGDWSYDAIEKYINLRYRLLPYIYSTSWEVTSKSSSMMRALVMDFASDENALDINDQYMFGKSFLICPVTEPMYVKAKHEDYKYTNAVEDFSEVKSTSIYLPAGTKWIDFWTGKSSDGGQQIEKETPIDIMPLYVKAGSIVPMGQFIQHTHEKAGPIEIRIYPGADGEFTLYEDEGDNYNYENGAYSTITFKWDDAAQTLSISDREGEFPGMLGERDFRLVLVSETAGTGLAESTPASEIDYSGEAKTVKF